MRALLACAFVGGVGVMLAFWPEGTRVETHNNFLSWPRLMTDFLVRRRGKAILTNNKVSGAADGQTVSIFARGNVNVQVDGLQAFNVKSVLEASDNANVDMKDITHDNRPPKEG